MIVKNKVSVENPDLTEIILSGNQEIAPGVHLISFRRHSDFIPGQVIKIGIDRKIPPRIYSICSGNHEDEIRVLFNIKQEGYLTPKLASLKPGDIILVSEPYGSFRGTGEPAVWIAAGTGIAPFYSMFRSGQFENKTLIHGARYLNQFYFEEELEWALGNQYTRCCSGEKGPLVFAGRVTDYLSSLKNLDPHTNYYLCGKAIMVVETRDLLISGGVPFDKINAEIYF